MAKTPKFRRLLHRRLARRARAVERALTHEEARAALTQFRAIRSRLNKAA